MEMGENEKGLLLLRGTFWVGGGRKAEIEWAGGRDSIGGSMTGGKRSFPFSSMQYAWEGNRANWKSRVEPLSLIRHAHCAFLKRGRMRSGVALHLIKG